MKREGKKLNNSRRNGGLVRVGNQLVEAVSMLDELEQMQDAQRYALARDMTAMAKDVLAAKGRIKASVVASPRQAASNTVKELDQVKDWVDTSNALIGKASARFASLAMKGEIDKNDRQVKKVRDALSNALSDTQDAYYGIDKVATEVLRSRQGANREAAWDNLPKGWTQASVKKFWESLTGDLKHKMKKCMKEMEGKVSDSGAFCGSLADTVDPGWRSRD